MAIFTRTLPVRKRDIVVCSVAGGRLRHRAVAQSHLGLLHRKCEDEKRGLCSAKVTVLARAGCLGRHPTKKGQIGLRRFAKRIPEQTKKPERYDWLPRWWRACQSVVRDEDIAVTV